MVRVEQLSILAAWVMLTKTVLFCAMKKELIIPLRFLVNSYQYFELFILGLTPLLATTNRYSPDYIYDMMPHLAFMISGTKELCK